MSLLPREETTQHFALRIARRGDLMRGVFYMSIFIN